MGRSLLFLIACGGPTITIPVAQQSQASARSFQLWILKQVGRDGRAVDCDALVNRSLAPADPNVIRVKEPVSGALNGDTIDVKDIATGESLFFIDLFSEPEQVGERVATGCRAGVTIKGAQTVTVDLELVRLQ